MPTNAHEAVHQTQAAGPSGQPGRRRESERNQVGKNLQVQLALAQQELQSTIDTRFQQEVRNLTTRYSGDTALAEKVATERQKRGFAVSDPDFASTLAPLQSRVAELEEQIRLTSTRRGAQTLAGSNGETLG